MHQYATFRVLCTGVVLALAGSSFAYTPALTQVSRATVIKDGVACSSCVLQVEKVVTIGAEDGPNIVLGFPYYAMVRDSRGFHTMAVTGNGPAWELRTYDKSGRFVRVLGASGAGPGEFSDVTGMIVTPGDSIYVFDSGNSRLTVLTPAWTVARTVPLIVPRVYHPAYVGSRGVVVNLRFQTPELAGVPLHLLGPKGEVSRSFGSDKPEYRSDTRLFWWRSTAGDPAGNSVWSGYDSQYVIEEWGLDGRLRQRLVRQADWFRPYLRQENVTPTKPPRPYIAGIQVDSAGILWSAVAVAAPDYTKYLDRNPMTVEGQRAYKILNVSGLADTVIEAIDPSRGEVVARGRIEELFAHWLGAGLLATYREDDGVPYINIWKVTVTRISR